MKINVNQRLQYPEGRISVSIMWKNCSSFGINTKVANAYSTFFNFYFIYKKSIKWLLGWFATKYNINKKFLFYYRLLQSLQLTLGEPPTFFFEESQFVLISSEKRWMKFVCRYFSQITRVIAYHYWVRKYRFLGFSRICGRISNVALLISLVLVLTYYTVIKKQLFTTKKLPWINEACIWILGGYTM